MSGSMTYEHSLINTRHHVVMASQNYVVATNFNIACSSYVKLKVLLANHHLNLEVGYITAQKNLTYLN
jgi:hypothetical protein